MKNLPSNCHDVREKLPLFLGGDLEADVLAEVREHVAHCGGCAREAEAAERAREVLVTSLEREAPRESDLWQGIRSSLVAEGRIPASLGVGEAGAGTGTPGTASPKITRPHLRLVRRAAGLAAAAAVLLVAFTAAPKFLGDGDAVEPAGSGGASVDGAAPLTVALDEATPLEGRRELRPGEVPLSRVFGTTLMQYSDPMRSSLGSGATPSSGVPNGADSLASNPEALPEGVRVIDGQVYVVR